MTSIMHVVGARPNFMKAAPVIAAMKKTGGFRQVLVHTGQHFDNKMSDVFFRELGMPEPDINMGVGRKTEKGKQKKDPRITRIEEIMRKFEPVLRREKPDWVFVYGDVNSTIACAQSASKMGVKVAHVESGLRSNDLDMPEELNRIATDKIADLLFVTEESGIENLKKELKDLKVSERQIHFVGNTMIDTLVRLLPKAEKRVRDTGDGMQVSDFRFPFSSFVLVTLHRPSNVDDPKKLGRIMKEFLKISKTIPILFPVHPRTRAMLDAMQLQSVAQSSSITFLPPLGYLDFLALQMCATAVVTDSGGIQEETSYLGVPCLTLRQNTERPATIKYGTNQLVELKNLYDAVCEIVANKNQPRKQKRIPLWDGKAAERIVEVMKKA